LPWYQARNSSVNLQSIQLLALQLQDEQKRWQWTGQAIRYARECIWIMAREEACSEGGGGVPDILILRATTFDDQLASEEVVWTFFQRVGVRIDLLGVIVESISSGEIGTRHWTSEQGAVAVVAAEECTNNTDLE